MSQKRKKPEMCLCVADAVRALNDGGRSRKDWKTRPIASLGPVLGNVWICNFRMSEKLLAAIPHEGLAVVNVRSDKQLADPRATNEVCIADSMQVEQAAFDTFASEAAEVIEEVSKKSVAVFVNCHAGINRASAAVASWLVQCRGLRFSKARKLLHAKKTEAARYFNCKNAYQCWEGTTEFKFSWPTLQGDGSTKLIAAVRKLET